MASSVLQVEISTTERCIKNHAECVRDMFNTNHGVSKYIIKAKPSRDNIDFITPCVTPHVYQSSRTRAHINSAFETFSKRFCSKFYIPDDVSMCISMLFNGVNGYGETDISTKVLVHKIITHHSSYVSNDTDSHYTIPPSFYFLHALNAINCGLANLDIYPDTFKELGMKVSASLLRYSLFELGDVYLRILINSLDKERAPASLLLDAPPNLVPLTECHARVLAERIKRMGILPRDGTMSTAIYGLYFDVIKECNDGLRPIPFDPDMVYSGCVFELKHLVKQGKIVVKTTGKRKMSVVKKEETTKRRCVIGSGPAIVTRDSSSLEPVESEECENNIAFLNKNETALARLLERLETSDYCSFIDVEDAPGVGDGAKEALVKYFEHLFANQTPYINSEKMSNDGFYTAIKILEKGQEKLLSDIRKHKSIEPIHRCREIHPETTLIPAIELSLGSEFPFETTVLSIFDKLSALNNADSIIRPPYDNVIDKFSPAGYTVLAKIFIGLSKEKSADGEKKLLKDLIDIFEMTSRSINKTIHPYGIVSWLLNAQEGYKYEYPEANRDALSSYILDKLCRYFTEKGRRRSFNEKTFFDKVDPYVYSSCVQQYLKRRAFAADSINAAIDAMCYVENGYNALIWIIRNAFPDNEDGKKTAFMRMIRNTVTQSFSFSPILKEISPSPSTSLEVLVTTFPDMCYMADKDFGVLRECIERESLAFLDILALPNVNRTINYRYRYYGNAPAICLGHLMVDTIQHDNFVYAFLKNGADPLVTTDEGENVMHFIARSAPPTDKEKPLDSFVAINPYKEWRRLRTDSDIKRLLATRRHYDGATPIMVALAHRNTDALWNFNIYFPVDDVFLTVFGRSDCLRTIDVMVLSETPYIIKTTPSVRLLAKAALEGKLYYNGDSPAPLNRVGLTFDEYAYRKVRNIKQVICQKECACESASSDILYRRRNKKMPSFKHRDDTWCAINHVNNTTVNQMYSNNYILHWKKKEYIELCVAIAKNDRDTLEKLAKERKQGDLTYSDGKCTICFEDMDERFEKLSFIEECDHVYHKTCIREWEKVKSKCPTCNTNYVESVSREEDVIVKDE